MWKKMSEQINIIKNKGGKDGKNSKSLEDMEAEITKMFNK